MIVIVEDAVFQRSGLALLSLVHLGFIGRHRIQTDPPYSPGADFAVNRWLARLSPNDRDEAERALEAALKLDVLGVPSDLLIRVAEVQRPDWTASIPTLPLPTAVSFLQKPLRVILENWYNDGAFLRSVPPSPWRKELQDNLDREWIEIVHGGGSDMKTRLENANREEALRLWALFDSDAREPGAPSKTQEALRQCCLRQGVPHRQLQRRAIENYLPIKALEAWVVRSRGKLREPRRRTVAAFAGMQAAQRHHYNMKKGFAGDRKSSKELPSLFNNVLHLPALQDGIDEGIASLFHQNDFQIPEEWFHKDGQHPETLPMVQSILRRL